MTEEMPPQILPTATGFAAREVLAALRKRNIATAPLLLRVVCRNTDLCGLRMKAMASPNLCRPLDSAGSSSMRRRRWTTAPLGFTLARQIDPRDVGPYFYAGSAARDLGEALALFRAIAGSRTRRLTQRPLSSSLWACQGMPLGTI